MSHRSKVENHIIPALGRRKLRNITPEHVRALYRSMVADRYKTATIRQVHVILSRCLKVAQLEGKVLRNVAESVEPPKPTASKTHGTISIQETAAIMATLHDPRKRARWLTALLGGLRAGESLGLD